MCIRDSSIAEVKTNAEGVAVVENLLPGVVEVIEKSVPEPYLLAKESQLVTLYPNRDRHVYFENYKRPVIEILKENEITHDPIEHVKMQVWYASNDTATGEYNDLGVFYTCLLYTSGTFPCLGQHPPGCRPAL